jgi:hypothetical protein
MLTGIDRLMLDVTENSEEEEKVVAKPVVPKTKWEGEDDEGKDVAVRISHIYVPNGLI